MSMTRKEYIAHLLEKIAELKDAALIAEYTNTLVQLGYVPEPVEAAPLDRHASEHVTAAPTPAKRRPGRPPRKTAA